MLEQSRCGSIAEDRRQGLYLADRLSKEPLAAVYASLRRRAQESAALISAPHQMEVQTLEGFCEISLGGFEGLRYEEIERRYPTLYWQWMEHPTEIQFPNGESFNPLRARVIDAANRLRKRHRGQSIAIVSHGGVSRMLLAEALSMPSANPFRIRQRYAALNLIAFFEEIPLVEIINESFCESSFIGRE